MTALVGIFCVRIYTAVPAHAIKHDDADDDTCPLTAHFRAYDMMYEFLTEQLQVKDPMPPALAAAIATCEPNAIYCPRPYLRVRSVLDLLVSVRWDSHGRVYVLDHVMRTFALQPQKIPSAFLFLFDAKQGSKTSMGS